MKKVIDKQHTQKIMDAVEQDSKKKAEEARREALMITLGGRRIGRLYFHIKAVEKDPESMAYILGRIGFFPFRVEARMDIGQFELIGVSPSFNRETLGSPIPIYAINVEEEGKVISVVLQEDLKNEKPGKGGVDLQLVESNK